MRLGDRKPRQIRLCPGCGKTFEPRYPSSRNMCCSKKCGGIVRRIQPRIESEDVDYRQAHANARKLCPPGLCAVDGCDRPGVDVHHINGDWRDNRLKNLERLCHSHHVLLHPKWNKDSVCTLCGKKAVARSLCHRHYKRWQMKGDPLVVKDKWGNEYKQVESWRRKDRTMEVAE